MRSRGAEAWGGGRQARRPKSTRRDQKTVDFEGGGYFIMEGGGGGSKRGFGAVM